LAQLLALAAAGVNLAVPPAPINVVLAGLVSREAALARRFTMPFGSSLLIVGRKAGP
jgi:hypothetical protein